MQPGNLPVLMSTAKLVYEESLAELDGLLAERHSLDCIGLYWLPDIERASTGWTSKF